MSSRDSARVRTRRNGAAADQKAASESYTPDSADMASAPGDQAGGNHLATRFGSPVSGFAGAEPTAHATATYGGSLKSLPIRISSLSAS